MSRGGTPTPASHKKRPPSGKQNITRQLYRPTATVKTAVAKDKAIHNMKKRLPEVEEEDAYKRLFSRGDILKQKPNKPIRYNNKERSDEKEIKHHSNRSLIFGRVVRIAVSLRCQPVEQLPAEPFDEQL